MFRELEIFQKKFFSLKLFLWTVESNFDSPNEFFIGCWFFQKSYFFFNLFLRTRRKQFWKPRRTFVDKRLKKISSKSQSDEKTSKSSYLLKLSHEHVDFSFDNTTVFYGSRPKVPHPDSKIDEIKNQTSKAEKFCFRYFLLTCQMQFWQLRRHMLDSWPKNFGSNSRKTKKHSSFKKVKFLYSGPLDT